jgi:ethanolamine kinase
MPAALHNGTANGHDAHVPILPLSYDAHSHSEESATQIVLAVRPEWAMEGSKIEFVRCTDGITNTLLKVVNRRAGLSKDDVDREAVLLRAYGNGTDAIIDRQREAQNHELLMKYSLAPELLARFQNGMIYRYITGSVTAPADLRKPSIYLAVARRLAQWHATVPCIADPSTNGHRVNGIHSLNGHHNGHHNGVNGAKEPLQANGSVAPGKPAPNLWTVLQKWILALPTETDSQKARQGLLQKELEKLIQDLSQRPGLGENGVRLYSPFRA